MCVGVDGSPHALAFMWISVDNFIELPSPLYGFQEVNSDH